MALRNPPVLYEFTISFFHIQKNYNFPVIKVYANPQIEVFLLRAKNKNLLLQSNRPLLRNKGLNDRRYEMKLIAGDCWNQSFLGEITDKIKEHIRQYEIATPEFIQPKNDPKVNKPVDPEEEWPL